MRKSWEDERIEPLQEYFESTQSQWNELSQILADWQLWASTSLSQFQRAQILLHFAEALNHDAGPKASPFPSKREWVEKLTRHMGDILNGGIPFVPAMDPRGAELGHDILMRSTGWIEQNF